MSGYYGGDDMYGEGMYGDGMYRTCSYENRNTPSGALRCRKYVSNVRGQSLYGDPNMPYMVGAAKRQKREGSEANFAAAARNPWLSFLREFRKRNPDLGYETVKCASDAYRGVAFRKGCEKAFPVPGGNPKARQARQRLNIPRDMKLNSPLPGQCKAKGVRYCAQRKPRGKKCLVYQPCQ